MVCSGSDVRRIDIAVLSDAKCDSNSSGEGTTQNSNPSEKKGKQGSYKDTTESYAFSFHRPPSFDPSSPSSLGAVESNFRAMLLKLNSAMASLPKQG